MPAGSQGGGKAHPLRLGMRPAQPLGKASGRPACRAGRTPRPHAHTSRARRRLSAGAPEQPFGRRGPPGRGVVVDNEAQALCPAQTWGPQRHTARRKPVRGASVPRRPECGTPWKGHGAGAQGRAGGARGRGAPRGAPGGTAAVGTCRCASVQAQAVHSPGRTAMWTAACGSFGGGGGGDRGCARGAGGALHLLREFAVGPKL